MPIYEYECKSCGHILDALQKMSEEPLKFCPECGEPELKKLLSAPRFRLKGAGWYETDFKTGDRKRNLHSDEKSESKTGSDEKSDAKKSDAKKSDAKKSDAKTSDVKKSSSSKADTA